jgi:sulfur carrier protein ThiS
MSSQPSITITVRLYSILRQRDGRTVDRMEVELPDGSRAEDVLHQLEVPESLELVLAINEQVVAKSAILNNGDHLSIIPAVAGGACMRRAGKVERPG